MSEELMIHHCASTLASIKTGSLFACPCTQKCEICAFVRSMNDRLGKKGMRFLPFCTKNGRYLIYAYRPEKLKNDLSKQQARDLLDACGYPCQNVNRCLCRLIDRVAAQEEFPHEIGLFLSYPPEDVYGFMHCRDQAKYCGLWKVYGDVDAARHTFERYRKCSDLYRRLWMQGFSIEQLTVAV